MKAPPTPSRMPATGRTATGSMRDFPSFCRKPKKSLQIFFNGLGAFASVAAAGASAVAVVIEGFLPRTVEWSGSVLVVVGRHEGTDRRGGVLGEGAGCQFLAVREGQRTDLRLDGGDGGPADAELVDAQAHQERDGLRVGRDAPADPDPFTGGVRGGDRLPDQAEDSGVEPVHLRGEPR